jgi:Na+/proline symporter
MPSGLSGFVIAGILAAALSSSLGALASSTVTDIVQKVVRKPMTEAEVFRQGRIWTVVWAGLLIVCAGLFATLTRRGNPIVEQGLSIAGFTYGALLGAFLLGLLFRKAKQLDAIVAFGVTVVVMAFVILGVKFVGPEAALQINFAPAAPAQKIVSLAYPWYTPLGVLVTLIVGGLMSLRHKGYQPPEVDEAVAAKAA